MLIDTITTSEKVAWEKSHVIVAISDQTQLASLMLIASLLNQRVTSIAAITFVFHCYTLTVSYILLHWRSVIAMLTTAGFIQSVICMARALIQ